jgi:dTMP kinase
MAPATIKDLATAATEAAAAIASSTAPENSTNRVASALPQVVVASTMATPTRQEDGGAAGGAVARGALVVLEGLDRSGKTTQVKLLEQRFVELGKKVKVMRFPGM